MQMEKVVILFSVLNAMCGKWHVYHIFKTILFVFFMWRSSCTPISTWPIILYDIIFSVLQKPKEMYVFLCAKVTK